MPHGRGGKPGAPPLAPRRSWGMTWRLTEDVAEYLAAAGDFLRSRAAENTVQLTAAEAIRVGGAAALGPDAPLFGWWAAPGGPVTAAFMHTPPYGLALTTMPAGAAAALAGPLAARGRFPPGVTGDTDASSSFAAAWELRTGQPARVGRRQRLYRLGRLLPPDPVPPGRARIAARTDSGLLLAWLEAFREEAGAESGPVTERLIADRLSHGGFTFWETGDGPVSLAGVTRAAAGQARIGPVYTPPARRGQGFGGAVTAAVSQAVRNAGVAEVLLYTDLANPTSNALYQRLGFRPVSDSVQLVFLHAPVRTRR
jgi:GNAT superfamily N-acetyltransferase